jgi:predicted DNA-binding transcriptional regulator AlpA
VSQTTLTRQASIVLLPDVEALLGVNADTLRKYVREGRLPRPRQLCKVLFWHRAELEERLAAATFAPKWVGPEEVEAA